MKFKLDENMGILGVSQLRAAGHDTATVEEQKMCSLPDESVIETCRKEGRCLITLDIEFANPLIYNPQKYPGIVLFRLPTKPGKADILDCVQTFLAALGQLDLQGKLWVVRKGRVREHQQYPLEE
jgi:predicted nuclease of predicted toxin-antitoxin system